LTEIRLLRWDEWEAALLLADQTFRDVGQDSMGLAFTHLFSPSLGQSYGLFIEGRLVSFVGLVPAIIRIGMARINVFSLGAVCTAIEHRGKGYASMLLDKVLQHADLAEASLLLVSGALSLYTRNDCFRYGTFKQYTLTADSAAKILNDNRLSDHAFSFREQEPTDWFRLKRLADSREVAFEQSLWDLASLIHNHALASNRGLESKVLVAENDGHMVAFTVVAINNQPSDSTKISRLVEWAGDPTAAAALLAYAVEQYSLGQLFANVGWYDAALSQQLSHTDMKPLKDDFTIRIMDIERFMIQLMPYLQEKNALLSGTLQIDRLDNGSFDLQAADQHAVLTAQELVSLIFDDTKQQSLFPIPFPHGAGLNYI
jgi:GNAT superfamily N-acetyltransferase